MSTLNRETAEAIIAPYVNVGAAVHWLHIESKRPIGDGWSTVPVASLDELNASYQPGNNVGVRLGMPSRLSDGQFLHVLDVDIRDPELADEAWSKVRELFDGVDLSTFPTVISGSGGASRHIYFTTSKPFYSRKLAVSEGKFREADGRWRYIWEIEVLGTGKHCAAPPSIHPDTGKPYTWEREFDFDLLAMGVGPHIPAAHLERLTTAESETFAFETKLPLTFKPGQLEAELCEIPDEFINDYHQWVVLGSALHHQTGGNQTGYKLWVQHSKRSSKFSEREMPAKWRSFGRNRRAPVTLASVRQWILDARQKNMLAQFDDVEVDDFHEAADEAETGKDTDPLDDLLGTPAAPVDDLDSLIDGAVANTSTELDWKSLLDFNEAGGIKPTLPNIALIMENDERIAGLPQINLFSHETVQRKLPGRKKTRVNAAKPTLQLTGSVWQVKDPVNGDNWSDDRDYAIRRVIESPKTQGGYNLRVTDRDLKGATVLASHKNPFHPVQEYLTSLRWDGILRAERLFIDYLGAIDDCYHRDVARLMLIAAVCRIFEPGHKWDTAVILEGSQGKRKSTFLSILGRSWFAELEGRFDDQKQMIELMASKWLLEIPELSVFSRSDVRAIKAFISRTTDRARLAYGRRAIDFPRQSIMVGTTNDFTYLRDESGGRRFTPVLCRAEEIDTDRFEREVDQIWAEAVQLYYQMRISKPSGTLPLYLTGESQKIAQTLQESRRVESADDGIKGQVEAWLNRPLADGGFDDIDDQGEPRYRDETCLVEIWCDCLAGDRKTYDQAKAQMLGRIVKNIAGWESYGNPKTTERFGLQRVYKRKQPIHPTQMDLVG